MMILVVNPAQSPLNPAYLTIMPTFCPRVPSIFPFETSLERIVSAGWDTTAQKIPARYPEANVIPSCVAFP
jgi:hypothetical protein